MRRGRKGAGVQPLATCIRVRFTYKGLPHRVTLRVSPTKANIAAAERLMVRVRREIELDIFEFDRHFPQAERALVASFTNVAEKWLARLLLAKSTIAGYQKAMQYLWIPAFGTRHIAHIKPSEIRELIYERAQKVTARTINNDLIPLRALFRSAIEDGLLDRSPMTPIANLKTTDHLPDPFTRDEMEAILDHLRDNAPEQAWNWYEFAFGTGMRPSEQIALRWSDVDWGGHSIRVQRARVAAQLKSTKTYQVRDVGLSDRMMDVLERQKRHSLHRGWDTPIFLNPVTGRPWPDVQEQRKCYFHPTVKALRIRKRNAYCTRATFATTALMGGVNPAYVARQLGHRNAGVTHKHYARWIDGSDSLKEAAKINQLFGKEGRPHQDASAFVGSDCAMV